MLTHMHMVVYTWCCWHIYKGGGVPRVERREGASLPPAELAGRDSALLRKLSVFSIAPVGNLEKSWECFLTEKHSPDAECGDTRRWPQSPVCLTLVGLSTGRSLNASGGLRPVCGRFGDPLCA